MKGFLKDPDETLDYTFNWADWLIDGDTISSATVSAGSGITVVTHTHTATTVKVWLSGGTVRTYYPVTVHIVTTGGREAERTAKVYVQER